MKSLGVFFILLLFCEFATVHGQRDPALVVVFPERKKEGFYYLSDSVIASEIASFNFVGNIYGCRPSPPLISYTLIEMSHSRVVFRHEDNQLIIETGAFRPDRQRLQFYRRSGYLYKIDGRYFYGNDGKIPHRKILSINAIIKGDTLPLPTYAFVDIFEPNLCLRKFFPSRIDCHVAVYGSLDRKRVYVYMHIGQIPYLYEITWIIRKGKYVGRVVDYAY